MPTRPETGKKLKANAPLVMNQIRDSIGGEYAENIPVAYAVGDIMENGKAATPQDATMRIREIGQTLMTSRVYQNDFLDQLVNRIGLVIISNRLYENPWAVFKRGLLDMGETIEEIFVDIAKAHPYNPYVAEETVFRREMPNVKAAFHTLNYKTFYKQTTQEEDLRAAFVSMSGVTNLISKIITAMYTSAYFDEYIMTKYLLAKRAVGGYMYPVEMPEITATTSDDAMMIFKEYSNMAQILSPTYNYAGVFNYTDISSQYFFFTAKASAIIDVKSLSRAFNLDKIDLMGHIVGVNTFTFSQPELDRLKAIVDDDGFQPFTESEATALGNIQAIMVDKDFFMIFDRLQQMETIRNPEGLYWNHFLHVWQTYSASPFSTAIVFQSGSPSITTVTVSGPTEVNKGYTGTYSANVTGTNMATTSVTWSVSGNTSPLTTIGANGILNVAKNETAASLTVTATSTYDSTKNGTVTVTVGN